MQVSTLFAILLGLGSAFAFPAETQGHMSRHQNHTNALAVRDLDCGGAAYCADCYPDNCGLAATVNFIEGPLNIGTLALSDISHAVAVHCSSSPYDVGSCSPDPISFQTTLGNGDSGTVTMSLTASNFPGWSKNLLVAAIQATLQGTVAKNTGATSDSFDNSWSGPTTNTIPASFAVAVLDEPERTIVLGLSVVDTEPESSDGICSGILGVGAAVAALAPEVGPLLGVAFAIASVFCNI